MYTQTDMRGNLLFQFCGDRTAQLVLPKLCTVQWRNFSAHSKGKTIFSCATCFHQLWGPSSLLLTGYHGCFPYVG